MSAFVRETADGWEVVEGVKRVEGPFASQIEALDAALLRNGGKTKDAILRDPDSHALNGAWRWLHATDVEDVPAYDGARIDETTVSQAVASLNAQDIPRPINGGAPDSPAPAPCGDCIATGYAHHAVEVESADGRRGAYVIAELLPDVARVIDSGRIAYTSIGLAGTVGDDNSIRDAAFDHLALTNSPAVTTLTPSASIRKAGDRHVAVRSARISARGSRGKGPVTMAKTSIRSELTKLTLRGAALEALAKLCTSLNISIDDELSSEEWESPTVAAVRAVRQLASAEKTLEALAAPQGEVARSHARAVLLTRAEIADADLEALAKAVGLEAGAAMADILKAIEGMEPKKADAMKSDSEATRSLRAELSVLRSATETDRAELAKLRAESVARSNEAWLDEQVKSRRLALRSEDRTELLSILAESPSKGRSLVEKALATRSAPNTDTVIRNDGQSGDPLAKGDDAKTTAVRSEFARIRAEKPSLSDRDVQRAAMTAARTKNPALFGAS